MYTIIIRPLGLENPRPLEVLASGKISVIWALYKILRAQSKIYKPHGIISYDSNSAGDMVIMFHKNGSETLVPIFNIAVVKTPKSFNGVPNMS